jgi:hypothetical protein
MIRCCCLQFPFVGTAVQGVSRFSGMGMVEWGMVAVCSWRYALVHSNISLNGVACGDGGNGDLLAG